MPCAALTHPIIRSTMPILAQETDLWPLDLLERTLNQSGDANWWALYCLARREKQLMRALLGQRISFYSPLVAKRSSAPSGRVRTSYNLLFPGYVFLFGSVEERVIAQRTNCVSRWLSVSDPTGLTRDLKQIQRSIAAGAALTPEAQLDPGQRVRIKTGRLAGLEGVVIRRDREVKLLISVNFLKQGASLLLNDCELESLD